MMLENAIPETRDAGSDWILPDGKREPACWPITEVVRKHAVHIAEMPGVERVSVWEEPLFGASCVGVSIVVRCEEGGAVPPVDRDAIGKAVAEQFPDWTYLPGTYTVMLMPAFQICWIKDKWGRPYSGQEG